MKHIFSLFVAILFAGSVMAVDLLTIDFTSGQGEWAIDNKELGGLDYVWLQTVSYGMKATAFVSNTNHAAESWLVSPDLDLRGVTAPKLVFSHARRFGALSHLSVRAKAGDGDWTILTVSAWPDGSSWNFVDAEASLAAFAGKNNVKVAFVYTSTTSSSATWNIKTVSVTGKSDADKLTFSTDDSNKTAEVRGYVEGVDMSSFNIPSTIIRNGTTYSVTSIGGSAFHFCEGMTSITIPNSVTSIGDHAFKDCSGLTSIIIPNSVTSIGDGAFSSCTSLTSITIPSSVTSIEGATFQSCSSLNSVTIPNSVTSIGDLAFSWCSSLTSFTIPNSVTNIDIEAFFACVNLTSILIPRSVTHIGPSAFGGCSALTSVVVEDGNSIYDSRNDCNAIIESSSNTLIAGCKNTIIPNNVKSIGYGAFDGCFNLMSITIPNSVTSIDDYAFYGCINLMSITIPNSVTSIGDFAFDYCAGLKNVIIPNSVTSIGEWTFACCSNLTSVTISNGVTSIGEGAFWGCSVLTSIINYAQIPQTIAKSVFGGGDVFGSEVVFPEVNKLTCKLYVPKVSVNMYKAANVWKEFANIIGIESSSAVDITDGACATTRKELRDGQLLIHRKGKMYNVQGQEVK